jgi:hypothetical protein
MGNICNNFYKNSTLCFRVRQIISLFVARNKEKILQRRKHRWHYTYSLFLQLPSSIKNLYYKGKGYELLSLYFNRTEDPNAAMSVLIDEDNVMKIRRQRKSRLSHRITRTSRWNRLELKETKNGFKQIYGDTVYDSYLTIKWIFENYLIAVLIMSTK